MQRLREHGFRSLLVVASFTAGLGLVCRQADAGIVKIKRDLTATSVAPNATGRTLTIIKGVQGRFRLKGRHLAANANFEVLVNGVHVGAFTTNGGGTGRSRFRSQPGPKDLVLGFDPRGATVSVRDEDGDDVLEGEIPDDSVDPSNVRCCVPEQDNDEDGEVESNAGCEDLTADECAAQGGTNLGSGTCMPDPCEAVTTTQGEQVVCCLPDGDPDDQAECEQRTAAACIMAHGINLGAGSCDPSPCEAIPHPETTRCCEPDDEGADCEHRTAADCAARGGVDKGPGMCEPHLCDGEHPDSIRCCESGDDGLECEQRSAAECEAHGGTNKGPGACEPGLCEAPPNTDEIRCCETDEDETKCEHRAAADCALHGGVDKGPGLCEPSPCDSSGGGG